MNRLALAFILICFSKAAFAFDFRIKDILSVGDSALSFSIEAKDSASPDIHQISIEAKSGSGWVLVRPDVGCPCMAKCRKRPIKIKIGEPARFVWDLLDYGCAKAQKGTYRIFIKVHYRKNRLAESPEFEVPLMLP